MWDMDDYALSDTVSYNSDWAQTGHSGHMGYIPIISCKPIHDWPKLQPIEDLGESVSILDMLLQLFAIYQNLLFILA